MFSLKELPDIQGVFKVCQIVRDYSALIDFRLIFCDKWQMIEQ